MRFLGHNEISFRKKIEIFPFPVECPKHIVDTMKLASERRLKLECNSLQNGFHLFDTMKLASERRLKLGVSSTALYFI